MTGGLARMAGGPDVTKRPVLATYDDYAGAQKAVDMLSDNGFPVQNVAIVGVDVRIVEAVLGRMSWGRAAVSGLFTGAWFGALVGLFVGLFSSTTGSLVPILALGLLYGAAFGIVWGLITYAFTRGQRDFVSRQQLQATRYDVLCEQSVLGDARRILGLGVGWPPTDPTATAPASSALPDATEKPTVNVAEVADDVAPGGVPPATA